MICDWALDWVVQPTQGWSGARVPVMGSMPWPLMASPVCSPAVSMVVVEVSGFGRWGCWCR